MTKVILTSEELRDMFWRGRVIKKDVAVVKPNLYFSLRAKGHYHLFYETSTWLHLSSNTECTTLSRRETMPEVILTNEELRDLFWSGDVVRKNGVEVKPNLYFSVRAKRFFDHAMLSEWDAEDEYVSLADWAEDYPIELPEPTLTI